jgi:hypothetical protein
MLTEIVNTYLSVRRAVGFKLHSVEKCLWSYANFATARGDIRVLSTTAVEWASELFDGVTATSFGDIEQTVSLSV